MNEGFQVLFERFDGVFELCRHMLKLCVHDLTSNYATEQDRASAANFLIYGWIHDYIDFDGKQLVKHYEKIRNKWRME